MKYSILFLLLSLLVATQSFSNGVAVVNGDTKQVLLLRSSKVNVNVVNQVATVVSTQTFQNQFDSTVLVKYAFPLYEDAAAVSLRWKINGVWKAAVFSPSPQDTVLPGSGSGNVNADLAIYLGGTPLYFDLEDSIASESYIIFELTYVQLLHYAFNVVAFEHPNDYSLLQTSPIDTQELNVHSYSDRSIVGIEMMSHSPQSISYSAHEADVSVFLLDESADTDFNLQYSLDPDELGLFSFSTFLTDSMNVCDAYGKGFFGFIVEPDPGDTVIIQKVFTLIIDRSGSMGGNKIQQARSAAAFVVNNLNLGDKFNIIDFDDQVTSLFPDHVDVNLTNQNTAINYINALTADGSTNISGAFGMAVPQFSNSDPNVANIIIFMTDGQATAGIQGTNEILGYVHDLIATNEVEGLSINSFGIGSDVNESLLSQLASQNNGLSQFFSAGDLLQVISDFYLSIQSPVLLNTGMSFTPQLASETYPSPLPNLYKGHQLILVGRYQEPGNENVKFTGLKYGDTVTYDYSFDLVDSLVEQNLFLTKLWAIQKINHLMIEYYSELNDSLAEAIKSNVIMLSLCYGVISPFTSFDQGGGGSGTSIEEIATSPGTSRLQNFPNPFKESTRIEFSVASDLFKIVPCFILDVNGHVIRVLEVWVGRGGRYEIIWDGKSDRGDVVPPGIYPYYISIGDATLFGAMEKF